MNKIVYFSNYIPVLNYIQGEHNCPAKFLKCNYGKLKVNNSQVLYTKYISEIRDDQIFVFCLKCIH